MGGIPQDRHEPGAFPVKNMDLSVLRAIIQGGIDKLVEAETVLIGGHSIEDKELKYGPVGDGICKPFTGAHQAEFETRGDGLVLTKPLGTGIVNTAIKAGMASADLTERRHPG